MSDQDRLLVLLTARGRIRLTKFKDILGQLAADKPDAFASGLHTYQVARALDMLGHCEYERDASGSINVSSACLAKLPLLGKDRYVLSGARSAATIPEIRATAQSLNIRLELTENAHPLFELLLPPRIALDFASGEEAGKLASHLGMNCDVKPAAWALACFSQSLSEFERTLEWHPRNVSLGDVEVYDASMAIFRPADAPDGLFLCRIASNPGMVYAVAKDQEARVESLDWARYWALGRSGVAVVLHDARERLVAVPKTVPLPKLLARALCQCSGFVPKSYRSRERDYFVFSAVPQEIASCLARKIEAEFVPQSISVP